MHLSKTLEMSLFLNNEVFIGVLGKKGNLRSISHDFLNNFCFCFFIFLRDVVIKKNVFRFVGFKNLFFIFGKIHVFLKTIYNVVVCLLRYLLASFCCRLWQFRLHSLHLRSDDGSIARNRLAAYMVLLPSIPGLRCQTNFEVLSYVISKDSYRKEQKIIIFSYFMATKKDLSIWLNLKRVLRMQTIIYNNVVNTVPCRVKYLYKERVLLRLNHVLRCAVDKFISSWFLTYASWVWETILVFVVIVHKYSGGF